MNNRQVPEEKGKCSQTLHCCWMLFGWGGGGEFVTIKVFVNEPCI